MRMIRKYAIIAVAALFLLPVYSALAEESQSQPEASNAPAFDPVKDAGYLPEGMEPYIINEWEKGSWMYINQGLRVEITRYRRTTPTKLVWYIADILSENEPMRTITFNEEHPGRTNGLPEDMAVSNKVVYAQNGDFYSYRVANDKRTGIIIRNGEIIYSKTNTDPVLALPSLDTAAFFPDGDMKVYESYEHTAQEYIDMGAAEVLSFGPILLRDGVINPDMYTNFTHQEPRSAIGIIEPGHYIGMLVEGRTDFSDGCGLKFMAETLYDLGCTDALNLDGGGTSAMVFMGQSVELGSGQGVSENARAIPDILAIGTYE
jgi:exopolysaccharide biosynthesis protein